MRLSHASVSHGAHVQDGMHGAMSCTAATHLSFWQIDLKLEFELAAVWRELASI